ncbi:hypothetical protein JCM10296v2_005785 [Rhodotorula toruloides]
MSLVLATLAVAASLAKAASHRRHRFATVSLTLTSRAEKRESVEGGGGVVQLTAGGHPARDDCFLLSFLAHDGEPVTLSLRPTADLVPTNGVKSVERWLDDETGEWRDGSDEGERQSVRGKWVKEEQAGLMRGADAGSGWARIVVLSTPDDKQNLRFQVTYSKGGEIFTIHSTDQYLRMKDNLDPEPPLVTPLRRSRRAFGDQTMLCSHQDTPQWSSFARAQR